MSRAIAQIQEHLDFELSSLKPLWLPATVRCRLGENHNLLEPSVSQMVCFLPMFHASEQNAERPAKRYAIIYTRVSTGRQVENASLDTQEQVCKDYCARQGWAVLRVFREEGESAKTADRTQLQ